MKTLALVVLLPVLGLGACASNAELDAAARATRSVTLTLAGRDVYIEECTTVRTPALGQVAARASCVQDWTRATGASGVRFAPRQPGS